MPPHTRSALYTCLVAQSCPSLCDPVDCSPPGSSIHGILQAGMLEWVVVPFSRRSSRPRDRTHVSCFLHWQVGSLPLAPPGKPQLCTHCPSIGSTKHTLLGSGHFRTFAHAAPAAGKTFRMTLPIVGSWSLGVWVRCHVLREAFLHHCQPFKGVFCPCHSLSFCSVLLFFWLCCVVIDLCRLSPVATSRGYSSLRWCSGFSLWSTGFSTFGSQALVRA